VNKEPTAPIKNPTDQSVSGVLSKANYETAMMSTTKIKVSFGPIGPEPFGPYPLSAGITNRRRPPTFAPGKPSCHPAITPDSGNVAGCPPFHDDSINAPLDHVINV
jgi:hypothetical protein